MQRYDSYPIKARFDESGYLRDEPVVARTGILAYKNTDGSIRNELRLPEDVFNQDSLDTYQGMPITIGHVAMVNSANHRKHSVGTVVGVGRQDGENVRAPLIIQDDKAIERAKELKELSVGYNVTYEELPGWYNTSNGEYKLDSDRKDDAADQEFIGKDWVRFDGIQRDIRVNHVAMVKKGRAGSIARLNLDGDEELNYDATDINFDKGQKMEKIRLDSGVEVEVAPEVALMIRQQAEANTALKTRADGLDTEKTALQVEVDTLKATVETIPEQVEQARKDAAESIKLRSSLEANAKKFGVAKLDGVSDLDLKKEVIAKTSKINLDGKDENYINIAYDLAASSFSSIADQRKKINNPGNEERSDNDDLSSAVSARQAMINKAINKGAK